MFVGQQHGHNNNSGNGHFAQSKSSHQRHQQGSPREAVELIAKAIAIQPNYPEALILLAKSARAGKVQAQVDLGNGEIRQVVSGIKQWYAPEQLVGSRGGWSCWAWSCRC